MSTRPSAIENPLPVLPAIANTALPPTGHVHSSSPVQDSSNFAAQRLSTISESTSSPTSIRSCTTDSAPSTPPKYVKWGISWRSSAYTIALALLGMSLAIAHHLYYHSLDGSIAGSTTRQQWSIRFGTTFSILVVACLKVASGQAYEQYLWRALRRTSFRVESLDNIFGLLSNLPNFFDLEIILRAKFLVFLALVTWCITLAGLTPPGTLSVVSGLQNTSDMVPFKVINWDADFFDYRLAPPLPNSTQFTATPEVNEVLSHTAQDMEILLFEPPAPNSSFGMTFHGPALQCLPANESMEAIFMYYANKLLDKQFIFTEQTFNDNKHNTFDESDRRPNMLFYSAFAPYAARSSDLPNDLSEYLPSSFFTYYPPWLPGPSTMVFNSIVQQLWVQTTNGSILCLLGNASYHVDLEYVDGVRTNIWYTANNFEPLWQILDQESEDITPSGAGYLSTFWALTNTLSGLIATEIDSICSSGGHSNWTTFLSSSTSDIMLSGLGACSEFINSFWIDNPVTKGISANRSFEAMFWNESDGLSNSYPNALTSNLFQSPSWMCRNGSLAKAIEDLAGNFTISLLSSANLTTPNGTTINVTMFNTVNLYEYDSFNLLVSYGIAIFFTLVSLAFGFWALLENGVAHSSDFSAIMATTRNPALDVLSEGHSLGSLPLDNKFEGVRLKFGILKESTEDSTQTGVPRIGFGLEENVVILRKGGKYR